MIQKFSSIYSLFFFSGIQHIFVQILLFDNAIGVLPFYVLGLLCFGLTGILEGPLTSIYVRLHSNSDFEKHESIFAAISNILRSLSLILILASILAISMFWEVRQIFLLFILFLLKLNISNSRALILSIDKQIQLNLSNFISTSLRTIVFILLFCIGHLGKITLEAIFCIFLLTLLTEYLYLKAALKREITNIFQNLEIFELTNSLMEARSQSKDLIWLITGAGLSIIFLQSDRWVLSVILEPNNFAYYALVASIFWFWNSVSGPLKALILLEIKKVTNLGMSEQKKVINMGINLNSLIGGGFGFFIIFFNEQVFQYLNIPPFEDIYIQMHFYLLILTILINYSLTIFSPFFTLKGLFALSVKIFLIQVFIYLIFILLFLIYVPDFIFMIGLGLFFSSLCGFCINLYILAKRNIISLNILIESLFQTLRNYSGLFALNFLASYFSNYNETFHIMYFMVYIFIMAFICLKVLKKYPASHE